jgi:hypothetical protein
VLVVPHGVAVGQGADLVFQHFLESNKISFGCNLRSKLDRVSRRECRVKLPWWHGVLGH